MINADDANLPSNNRIPSLDGIRALAIAFVLIGHSRVSLYLPRFLWIPDDVFGVWVFFVLSGFLITWLMLKEESRTGSISLLGFYRRRAFRILPVCWLFLLVVSLLWWSGVYHLRSIDILRPLTFSFSLTGSDAHRSWITLHTWSLTIEEHFYLIWPIAFIMLAGKKRRLIAVSLILLVIPIVRIWIYSYHSASKLYWVPTIVGQGDFIGWGCFLALLSYHYHALVLKVIHWRPLIGRIIALLVIRWSPAYFSQVFRHHDGFADMEVSSIIAIAITYLIASFMEIRTGVIFKFLNWKPVTWIGVLSYSLYIWQQMFLGMSGSDGRRIWERWPLNIICLFVIACCSYYFVESPMLKFKRPHRHSESGHKPMSEKTAWLVNT
jgi:peptidoglycan/LPS O-acetylase OafA/YrhL